MEFQIKINTSDKLALRDPEDTPLGRSIVRKGLVLMDELGLEHFTFKKLAHEINTTEASIYRYFENKHRLLLYLLTWYWNYMEYLVVFSLHNLNDPKQKLQKIIALMVSPLPDGLDNSGMDKKALHNLVIAESSKAYLIREVEEINSVRLFKPYKDLCGRIAGIMREYNPTYPYPHSLSSTLIEMAHFQHYFMLHLPSLTNFSAKKDPNEIILFLDNLVFSTLSQSGLNNPTSELGS
ncbi:MAG: TetR/AcrR family transcriptional regulator [Chitinophagales bacterium]|jgi:AcrR family transcriptional regulator